MGLDHFSPPVRAWFESSFPAPTDAQAQGWPAIAAGEHTLILAPTGSGKTLAAFLWGIDRLMTEPPPEKVRRTRLLYVSPLRALAVDVEKNLRAPLAGQPPGGRAPRPHRARAVGRHAHRRHAVRRASPARARSARPPHHHARVAVPHAHVAGARRLRNVDAVIIDEIHALAATKRGAHLSLTLERLEAICDRSPQRIGLSATQRPLDEIARFLGGRGEDGQPRPVTIVDAGMRKPLDVEVIVPVDDMGALGEVIEEPVSGPAAAGPVRRSIWPAMHPRLLELVESHRSTLIFVNSRRLAERLATRLNELKFEGENAAAEASGKPPADPSGYGGMLDRSAGVGGASRQPALGGDSERSERSEPSGSTELVRAHHGSLSRERRLQIEDELKSGRLRGLVCTSSLELGIDMGAVDLVVQVESPRSVASGLQRIGRAGHQVGEPSRGKLFPKHRADLVEATVVVQRMRDGLIEHTRYPRNPLDVLAQQIVAMCALDEWKLDELAALVRRSANFAELSDDVLAAGARSVVGALPERRVRRAATAHRVGSGQRHRAWPCRCAAAGRHERRHDSRPRAVRRVPARRHPRRRARRRDGVRVAARRDVPARCLHVAHRRHHVRARSSSRPRPACRGRCRSGTAMARVGRWSSGARSASSCARSAGGGSRHRAVAHRLRSRPARRRQPRAVPRRAGRGHRRGARRSHHRRRALPRRDRRLAGLHPVALRRAGARALGDGVAGALVRAVGHRRRAAVERRRHRAAVARGHRRAADRRAAHRSRRDRRSRHRPAAEHRAVRVAVS